VTTALQTELFRKLPSVDDVVRTAEVSSLTASYGHDSVVDAARSVLTNLRHEITSGLLDEKSVQRALSELGTAIEKQLRQTLSYSLRAVINATGVILHTNLGRAPLGDAAIEHIRETASSYSNLEFDLSAGERGKRDVHISRLFGKLLGEEIAGSAFQKNSVGLRPDGTAKAAISIPTGIATIVVNNNAAAVLLALNTLADGGEVIVSRGELVEIGGAFRNFPFEFIMSLSQLFLRQLRLSKTSAIRFPQKNDQAGKEQKSNHSGNCGRGVVQSKGMERGQEPVPDTNDTDQRGEYGGSQSAKPRGKNHCRPNSVIRIVFP